jgi:uncharacterized protein YbaR (Trm112 family)
MKFGCDGVEVAEVALSKKKPKAGAKCGRRGCKNPPEAEHMLYCTEDGRAYAAELQAPRALPDLREEESDV